MEQTRSVYPGLYVVGTAAAVVHGGPVMGPIFRIGLLSGRKAAELILTELKGQRSGRRGEGGEVIVRRRGCGSRRCQRLQS